MIEITWTKDNLILVEKILSKTTFYKEQMDLISNSLKNSNKILDLGVGFGNLAKILIGQGKKVYGLDISDDSLEYSKSKIASDKLGNFILINNDMRELNYDSEFDAVSCVSNINFNNLLDLEKVVNGVYRALKPNGLFAVTACYSNKMAYYNEISSKEVIPLLENREIEITDTELKIMTEFSELQSKSSSESVEGLIYPDSLIKFLSGKFDPIKIKDFYNETSYLIEAIKI